MLLVNKYSCTSEIFTLLVNKYQLIHFVVNHQLPVQVTNEDTFLHIFAFSVCDNLENFPS